MFNKCPKGVFTKICVWGGTLMFALLWGVGLFTGIAH